MTGLERNAEVVHLASYAPLLAHAEGWQWTPDLIWFDNLQAYGTANYYVQKMYSTNRGTHVLPMLSNKAAVTGQNKLYATAALDKPSKEIILKLVNGSDQPQSTEVTLTGTGKLNSTGKLIVLTGDSMEAVNTFERPKQIAPVEKDVAIKGKKVSLSLPPSSFSVVRIKMN
jgi:alpha-N-arabinofuranosidase